MQQPWLLAKSIKSPKKSFELASKSGGSPPTQPGVAAQKTSRNEILLGRAVPAKTAFQGPVPAADVVVRAMDSISPSEWPTLDFALSSSTNKREQNDNLASPPPPPPARRDKHSDYTPQDMRKKKSDAASGREGRNQKHVRSTSAAAAARDDPSPKQKCLHADVGSPSDSSPSPRSTFSPAKRGPSLDAESRGMAATARTLVAVRLRPPNASCMR